jgi:hypothetical protein
MRAEEMASAKADCEERVKEAEAALEKSEDTSRKVDRQVGVARKLREGWARVHAQNNLAELFTNDYRRTH